MYLGNIANWGFIAKSGEWLYYNNFDELKLYRVSYNFKEKFKITDDDARFISVVDKWIYYVKYEGDNEHKIGTSICKIKTDGSQKVTLIESKSEDSFIEINYLLVYENCIYYWLNSYSDSEDCNYLCKADINGENQTILLREGAAYLNIIGEWIYFISLKGKIYKLRTDGTQKTLIEKDNCESLIVDNEWLYYCNCSHGRSLYKIKNDGTLKTKIIEAEVLTFNVKEDVIFFSKMPSEFGLYKVKTDGTDKKKLNDDMISSIYIIDNNIYYNSGCNGISKIDC